MTQKYMNLKIKAHTHILLKEKGIKMGITNSLQNKKRIHKKQWSTVKEAHTENILALNGLTIIVMF